MTKYVHLQGIGIRPAKAAGELRKGDTIMWNFGYTSTVLLIQASPSGKTVEVTTESCDYGTIHTRRLRSASLVAMA